MRTEAGLGLTRVGELAALCESSTGTVEEGALILARDAQPSLQIAPYLSRLDALAERVAARLARATKIRDQLGTQPEPAQRREAEISSQIVALRLELFEREGLRGNDADYYDPRNSYLNQVLDRKLGIPITLAVVVLAVCRRVGLVAEGIGFPGHFLVRLGGPSGVLLDPFRTLRLLGPEDLDETVKQRLGPTAQVRASHLETADMRAILVRMLSNLRLIHEKRGDKRGALLVLDRLVELDAGAPALRDRGLLALELGASAVAVHDLEAYLARAGNPADRADVQRALQRARARSSWN